MATRTIVYASLTQFIGNVLVLLLILCLFDQLDSLMKQLLSFEIRNRPITLLKRAA